MKTNKLQLNHQLIVDKISIMLMDSPESFSAKWYNGKAIDHSIRNEDKNITIMIETGQIVSPIRPEITKKQLEQIKELIAPIVLRDTESITEQLFS